MTKAPIRYFSSAQNRFPIQASGPESPITPKPIIAETLNHWLDVLQDFGMPTRDTTGSTLQQVRNALRIGAPRDAFDRLRTDLQVSTEELAEILGIPTRTLARRTERFKPDESERILRIAFVFKQSTNVLGDAVTARHWMTQPKTELSGLTPLHCCDTEFGAREVEDLLAKTAHSVFS